MNDETIMRYHFVQKFRFSTYACDRIIQLLHLTSTDYII